MALMTEDFTIRGEHWRRIPVNAADRYVVGVDLGQSSDPTAICVLHWSRTPLDTWSVTKGHQRNISKQDAAERYDVRHLQRLPLGLSYPDVVQHVGTLMARPPLHDGCDLVVDDTGVGKAVSDIMIDAGMAPQRVTITAGNEPTDEGNRRWHVPKAVLISTLDARLHTGELRFAADLTEAGAMADELKDFRRKVSAAGRYSYEARVGRHDD